MTTRRFRSGQYGAKFTPRSGGGGFSGGGGSTWGSVSGYDPSRYAPAKQRFGAPYIARDGVNRNVPTTGSVSIHDFGRQGGAQTGGGIFGGNGGFRMQTINLDPYRRAELSAMERLLNLQFDAQRTQLEGTVAQTELDRDWKIANIQRNLRGQHDAIRGNALSRGILDSGIFVENFAEAETMGTEAIANQEQQAGALIGGLRSQIGLLNAQKAAQIASQRAQIERAYAMARLQGGG